MHGHIMYLLRVIVSIQYLICVHHFT